MCLAAALTFKKTSPVSQKAPGMAFTQGDQRTWPLWFACYHQSDPKWLPWHHHYSFSSVLYVATILKRVVEEKLVKRKGAFKKEGQRRLAKNHCQTFSNNRFPNTLSEGVGCRCNPGVHQQRVSEFSCQYRMFEIFEARSPYLAPSLVNAILPLHTPLHIFTRLSFPPPSSTPPFSSVCRGQSQIYNNCQSQGWQIN